MSSDKKLNCTQPIKTTIKNRKVVLPCWKCKNCFKLQKQLNKRYNLNRPTK